MSISIASYSSHAITYNYLYPSLFGSLTARKQEWDDKVLVEIEGAVHDAETEDPLNVPTLPVTNKRMPKTSKKFGCDFRDVPQSPRSDRHDTRPQ